MSGFQVFYYMMSPGVNIFLFKGLFLPLIPFKTVAKVNSLVDYGGKADKRHFDRAERVKCKALRVSAQGVYFR